MPRFKVPVTLVVDYVIDASSAADATATIEDAMRSCVNEQTTKYLGTHEDCDGLTYEIGSPEAKTRLFTVEFTVRYRVEDVEAEDEQDAEYEVESGWQYMSKDEIDFEIDEVEEQE